MRVIFASKKGKQIAVVSRDDNGLVRVYRHWTHDEAPVVQAVNQGDMMRAVQHGQPFRGHVSDDLLEALQHAITQLSSHDNQAPHMVLHGTSTRRIPRY